MGSGIKISAPITVANLAVGFDAFGVALHPVCDEIIIRKTDKKGLQISKIEGAKLSYNPKENVVGVAANSLLNAIDESGRGLDIHLIKKIKPGSGLGSSAASAAAAVFAVNTILGKPLSKKELLPYALLGEQFADGAYHADNVGPALLGGFQLIRDNKSHDIHRIIAPKGIYFSIVLPEISVLTKDSRKVLSDYVDLKKHIAQGAHFASTILALLTSDFDLLGRSMKDLVIEDQRASLIPGFRNIQEIAYHHGALACSISGAGPAIFSLSNNSLIAETISQKMESFFQKKKVNCKTYISTVNHEGAKIV